MPIEHPSELAQNLRDYGDRADFGASSFYGMFDLPSAEDLLVEGTAPAFWAQRSTVEALGVTIGTVIDRVYQGSTTGETFGPYRVKMWTNQQDGVMTILGLEQR